MTENRERTSQANALFSAALKHILLIKVNGERGAPPAETSQMRPTFNVNTNIRYGKEVVEAFFTVNIAFPSPDKPFYTLEYTVRGVFGIEPNPTAAAEHQRAISALVISMAWPYLRRYAESLLRDMEIVGPLPLPYTVSVQEVLEKLDITSQQRDS